MRGKYTMKELSLICIADIPRSAVKAGTAVRCHIGRTMSGRFSIYPMNIPENHRIEFYLVVTAEQLWEYFTLADGVGVEIPELQAAFEEKHIAR